MNTKTQTFLTLFSFLLLSNWVHADERGRSLPLLCAKAPLTICSFTPDSQKLVSVSSSAAGKSAKVTWQLWQSQTGALLKTVDFYTPPISAVCLSTDGKTLTTAHRNQVLIWNSQNGRLVCRIYTGANDIALSPDGRVLAAIGGTGSSAQNDVRLWDVATRKWLGVLKPDLFTKGTPLSQVTLSDWMKREDKIDAGSGHQVKRQQLQAVWWNPNGETIMAADNYDTCWFWNYRTHKVESALTWIYRPFVFARDGLNMASVMSYLVTASPPPVYTGLLQLTEVITGKSKDLTVAEGSGGDLESASGAMAFSPDSQTLAAEIWQQEQAIRFYDVASGKVKSVIKDPFQSSSSHLVFSPNGRQIALTNGKEIALIPLN